jgi:hypothetical protein
MSTEESQVPATGFHGIRGGGAVARFAAAEAMLLRGLISQVAELLGEDLSPANGDSGPAQTPEVQELEALLGLSENSRLPDDPVLARLLPDAYPDDLDAAGEFRRYTEHSVRSGKVAAAQTVLDTLPETGGRIRLSPDEAQAWLRSINDVRLALGVRLEVSEDREAMLERAQEGGPLAAGLWIYDWLSLLQETLVEALW